MNNHHRWVLTIDEVSGKGQPDVARAAMAGVADPAHEVRGCGLAGRGRSLQERVDVDEGPA